MNILTKAQQRAYEFIQQFILTQNISPTVEEIAKGIGIKSKGVAYRYIQALEDAKLIKLNHGKRRNISLYKPAKQEALHIPLLGTIAAGKPIEAVTQDDSIDLGALLGTKGNRYALKVKGDSMIEEGIFDGDIVICEQCDHADNGAIVVALVEQQEATLKRITHNTDGTVTLSPANANLKPMVFPAEQVQIQGRFIGLLRING